MGNFGDAFLQSYMATQAQQAEQKRQMQQFQFQNFWNNAKQQQETQQQQAALAQKALYDQGILANDKVKADAEASANSAKAQESMASIYRQGGQDVQPQTLDPTPTTLPGSPVLAMHTTANLPQGVTPAVPLQAAPPPNTISLQGKQIHIPTGAEASQALAQQHGAALQDAITKGLVSPEQGKAIGGLLGLSNVLGRAPNEAEASIISPKPPTPNAGDEPLGATADSVNKMTLDRLKVLDPSITAVPPHMLVTPQTTKNQYAVVHQNLQGIETAKAAVANAQNAQEDRSARLALQQQLGQLAQGREADRVATENEKYIGPARDAVQTWQTYKDSGNFTGAGDIDLLHRFNDLAKSNGQRGLTKQQEDLIFKAQSAQNSVAGKWANLTGGKLFSDDLRQQLGDEITKMAATREAGLANKGKLAPAPAPTPAPAQAPKVTHRYNPVTGKIEAVAP